MARKNKQTEQEQETGFAARLSSINSKYKSAEIVLIGQSRIATNVDVIPTGSIGLNHALGVGGFPRGRITEVSGPEQGGKSTLVLETIAEALRMLPQDEGAGYVDAENALSLAYCQALGIDLSRFGINQPDSGERAFQIIEDLCGIGCPICGVDSVAALVPEGELEDAKGNERAYGEGSMASHAAMMSKCLRRLNPKVAEAEMALLFINQIREKPGVMFGNPETTTGGRALKFYSSVRVDIRPIGKITQGSDKQVIGSRVRAKVVKNKLAPPFREAEFSIIFGKGIDRVAEAVDLSIKYGILQLAGNTVTFNGTKLAVGQAAACELVGSDDELYTALRDAVVSKLAQGEE